MTVRSYHDLEAWQQSMGPVTDVYSLTAEFPESERFGLTNQLRRAAVSIPSNIAEGQGRLSTKDFLRFLYIARGSLNEVQTQLEIARRLNFIKEGTVNLSKQADTVGRLLNGLIRSLNH